MVHKLWQKLLNDLIKYVEFENKERYSKLSYSGIKKFQDLIEKVAIIAFSIEEVYAIAELVRSQKGGAAVIMGSLSPKKQEILKLDCINLEMLII